MINLSLVKTVPPQHPPRTQQILKNLVLVYSSGGISDFLFGTKQNYKQATKSNPEQCSVFKLEKGYFMEAVLYNLQL